MYLVIHMNIFENINVTDIQNAATIHSEKGRYFEMTNRPTWGLTFCFSGRITYTMNGVQYISDKHSAILLPQGGSYSLFDNEEGLFPLINFTCDLPVCNEILVFPVEDPEVCRQLYTKVRDYALAPRDRLRMLSSFYELLACLSPEIQVPEGPLRIVLQYIKKHLSDPGLSNTTLAQAAGISEVYLRKLFVAHCNTTPKQCILELRIEKAKRLLTNPPYRISSIAEQCGFSSPYHFSRAFKAHTGLTPSAYAAQSRSFYAHEAHGF